MVARRSAPPSPATAPLTVALLALPGVVAFDAVLAGQVFGDPTPTRDHPRAPAGGLYTLRLCGLGPGPVTAAGGLPFVLPAGLEALADAHTIVVPGVADHEQPPPPTVLDALRAAHARGARLLSICTGAFILAAAGVLDGRRATTHWARAARLAALYPRVCVDPRVLYVDEGVGRHEKLTPGDTEI